MTKYLGLVAASVLFGCGAGVDGLEDGDLADGEFPVAEVHQAWTESTCGKGSPDANAPLGQEILSPNASYGSFWCSDAFRVGVAGPTSFHAIARYAGGLADGQVFPCNGMWSRVQLWKRRRGAPPALEFIKVAESPVELGTARVGGCVAPRAQLPIPTENADYIVIGQAGYTTSLQRVGVGTINPSPR
jgi:hypothetical protein